MRYRALIGLSTFAGVVLSGMLVHDAGAAHRKSPCTTQGPFSPRVDPDLLRDDVEIEPMELETARKKRSRTAEQKRRADRGVCQDPQTGKTITLPDPRPHDFRRMKDYPGGDEGDPGLPRDKRKDAATPSFLKTAAMTTAFVFPPDDRKLENPATSFPFRAVVKLRVKFPNGERKECTGFMIGSRHVLTAGHCVKKASRGGWIVSGTAIPGRGTIPPFDVLAAPFGTANIVARRASSGWIDDEDAPDYDWGLITLDRDFNVGSFGLLYPSDSTLDNTTAYVIGYPGELGIPKGQQQFFVPNGGSLFAYDSERVEYKIDVTGGQSGSPVYRFWEGKRAAFAINTTHVSPLVGSDYNAGPRITKHRYHLIRTWQCEDVC